MARYITPRQQETLDYVRVYVAQHAMPPTVREVAAHSRVTPRSAWDVLRALTRKGQLVRRTDPGGRTARTYVPATPPTQNEAVLAERARILDLARTMLVDDYSGSAITQPEIRDFIEAIDIDAQRKTRTREFMISVERALMVPNTH